MKKSANRTADVHVGIDVSKYMLSFRINGEFLIKQTLENTRLTRKMTSEKKVKNDEKPCEAVFATKKKKRCVN